MLEDVEHHDHVEAAPLSMSWRASRTSSRAHDRGALIARFKREAAALVRQAAPDSGTGEGRSRRLSRGRSVGCEFVLARG
ncbi:hypothetical protein ACOXH8_18700 [Nannocystis pusilla]